LDIFCLDGCSLFTAIATNFFDAGTVAPVVATSVTDTDTQNISSKIVAQVAEIDVVLRVKMNDIFAEVDEPVVEGNGNSNADTDTNETPCLSGWYSNNDTIGPPPPPPPPPPLMVPTRTNLDTVDGKAATAFGDYNPDTNIRLSPLVAVPTVARPDDELEVLVEAGKKVEPTEDVRKVGITLDAR